MVIVVFYSFGSHGQTCLSCFKKGKMTFDELKAVTDCIMSAPVLNNQVVRYCFCGYHDEFLYVNISLHGS